MLHEWMKIWFSWVDQWGYWGVFVLMAMESSILPVPSEVVMPPAAFWAAQGRLSFWGVVAAGTAGSMLGSWIGYWMARLLGAPLLKKWGKYFFLPPQKLRLAEEWVSRFGVVGIFIARLLPVVRHLISYPAGAFKMNVWSFSGATTLGAGLWCFVLSWFGEKTLGAHPELLESPAAMVQAIRQELIWFVAGMVLFAGLYGVVAVFQARLKKKRSS